jgi:hypothetical protein
MPGRSKREDKMLDETKMTLLCYVDELVESLVEIVRSELVTRDKGDLEELRQEGMREKGRKSTCRIG